MCFRFRFPAVKHLTTLELHRNVTFFVGENGTGKSTLLEAIAVAEGFNPEGGSRHAMFKTQDTHNDQLPRKLQLESQQDPPRRQLLPAGRELLQPSTLYRSDRHEPRLRRQAPAPAVARRGVSVALGRAAVRQRAVSAR